MPCWKLKLPTHLETLPEAVLELATLDAADGRTCLTFFDYFNALKATRLLGLPASQLSRELTNG